LKKKKRKTCEGE